MPAIPEVDIHMMFLVMQNSAFQSGTKSSDGFSGVAGRDLDHQNAEALGEVLGLLNFGSILF